MKRIFIIIISGLFLNAWLAAQVAVSNDITQAHPSAGLEIKFSDKGYLQPRLTGSQILGIPNPDVGLMVYNLTANKPVYFDGKRWRNYDGTDTWFGCGETLEVVHIAGNAAPVNKTVLYGTVTGIPGEPDKCWITRNLGADQQASTKGDNSEASAGWYWQFNKLQGYKHDGTTRTPNTTWITSTSENANWTVNNDPCAVELGGRWRIPTGTEWKNIDAGSGNWSNWNGPWGSVLKLHAAGQLNGADGVIALRGTSGRYWGNGSWTATRAWMFCFGNSSCFVDSSYQKWYAGSVRCIQCPEATTPMSPSAGSHLVYTNRIIWQWNIVAGAAGYKWNTTDNYFTAYDMLNSLFKIETSLDYETAYTRFIWAYDSCGGHSNSVSINETTPGFSCGTDSLYICHIAGNVAPVSKTIRYGTVTGIPGEPDKCWITSNLGSDHQATAKNDATEASAGWYWQFNKKQGFKHTGTTVTPTWTVTFMNESSDWIPANDPCAIELGAGWRLPTEDEWLNVYESNGWTDWFGPWNSALKMHAAGYIKYDDGSLQSRGNSGYYSSRNEKDEFTRWIINFSNSFCNLPGTNKADGYPVRCIEP